MERLYFQLYWLILWLVQCSDLLHENIFYRGCQAIQSVLGISETYVFHEMKQDASRKHR